MKVNFENLGTIKSGCFSTNKLTIIFGKNNSGKTYLSYATYIILKKLEEIIDNASKFEELETLSGYIIDSPKIQNIKIDVENHIEKLLKNFNEKLNEELTDGFKVPTDFFKKTRVNIDHTDLKDSFYSNEINLETSDVFGIKKATIRKSKKSWLVEVISINDLDEKNNIDDIDESVRNMLFKIYIDKIKNKILSSLINDGIENTFIITSERTGIELFYKDIDNNRSNISEEFSNKNKINKLTKSRILSIFDSNVSYYSMPISDNIKAIRNSSREIGSNFTNSKYYNLVNNTLRKMAKGIFKREKTGGVIFVTDGDKSSIPLPLASSSIKALSLFDIYINKMSSLEDTLIIDEPELNLHPDNQIIMAELIARMVNAGIKVIMTTHSDYMVREINNRIKLKTIYHKNKKIALSFVESELDLLDFNDVYTYKINETGVIEKISVDKDGMSSVIFDEVIQSSYERELNISLELDLDNEY
ncbi:AAA family ATPase [Proteus mirabilis]|nr:AAA family ATPase [Proteus mirabilis]